MVSAALVRDVGIQFLGLKLSLRLLARLGKRAEKEPELEGVQPQRSPAAAWETKPGPALAHAL